MPNTLLNAVVLVFAIIGLLAVIGIAAMFSMHGAMMGGTHGGMMAVCGRAMATLM